MTTSINLVSSLPTLVAAISAVVGIVIIAAADYRAPRSRSTRSSITDDSTAVSARQDAATAVCCLPTAG